MAEVQTKIINGVDVPELGKAIHTFRHDLRVTFRVKSDASPEQLEECARFSPVFDVVTHGTNVDLRVLKAEAQPSVAPEQVARPQAPEARPRSRQ